MLLPSLITLSFFILIKLLINNAVSHLEIATSASGEIVSINNPHQFICLPLKLSFSEVTSELSELFFYHASASLVFGIHGPNLLDPITHDIYTNASAHNITAAAAGLPLPNIVTKEFFDHSCPNRRLWATLGLLFAILFISRDGGTRVGQISLPPGLFNINETIIFGLPIIINPIFLIPFLQTPIILVLISYFAMYFGLVPAPSASVSWTTPTLISGCRRNGFLVGFVLQLFNLILSIAIYTPFVIMSNHAK